MFIKLSVISTFMSFLFFSDVSFFNELLRSSVPVRTQYGYLGDTVGDSDTDSTDAAVLRAHDETETPAASTGARPKRKGSCTAIIAKK